MYSHTAPVPRMCMCHVAGQQPMQGQYLTFESELPNRVEEATGYKHQAGERQTQANNNNRMIGAKAHKHHGYSVSDADPVGVSDASHPRKQGK